MAFEKLKKKPFKVGSLDFTATDCGKLILVDVTGASNVTNELVKKETKNYPDKDKLVFFPYSHVRKFNVPNDERQYKVKYKFGEKEASVSEQVYTAVQVNAMNFIVVANVDIDHISYYATHLKGIVPEGFVFAVIHEDVKVIIMDA